MEKIEETVREIVRGGISNFKFNELTNIIITKQKLSDIYYVGNKLRQ